MTTESQSLRYRHRPLLADEIRLCRVRQQLSASGLLQLELRHFLQEPESAVAPRSMQLKNAPEYTALSYTWGSEVPVHEILINGASIAVRENLFMFLTTAHNLSEYIWFWIDQVCIDQSNVVERNAVVRDMEAIYSRAISVRVWLGLRNKQTDFAFGVLREIELLEQKLDPIDPYDDDPMEIVYMSAQAAIFRNDRAPSEAFAELMRRPYWTRQWIAQEVRHAKHLQLQCGTAVIAADSSYTPPYEEYNAERVFR